MILIINSFLCFTAWLLNINNLGEAVFNMLATSKSCGNICFFDQHYQPGTITSQVSVLMIEYLVAVSFELSMVQYVQYFWLFCDINYCCSRNRDKEKC